MRPDPEIFEMVTLDGGGDRAVLLCRTGSRTCGLPIESVVETMRPLDAHPMSGAPPYVLGVAVVRGRPTPVVDATLLLEGRAAPGTRWVLCRVGERQAVLAVGSVVGVARASVVALDAAAPILLGCAEGVVESLGVLDHELMLLLDAARWIPETEAASK